MKPAAPVMKNLFINGAQSLAQAGETPPAF